MKLLKPGWVTHDGNAIFSVDIHPDGSRFATGGQGENSGKVIIWNMAPVRSEEDEKNEKVPKMLCHMDNHLACVNAVRWSNHGKYLASGGDDKLIMIWQIGRYTGPTTVFGSGGKLVNVESWRCVVTLRGHSGDVIDLSWSPNDAWMASCSVDNTVVIWNALKFPEQIKVLRGHTSLVKGVTWDPVGKYLATQSDDKTLRVWRTLDWQQEASVTKPFEECGATTHVLRLSWSPDGHFIVSAHAMNNRGPTAQIIEREGWKTSMDFVGHRKAVTVAKFNPNILQKKKSGSGAQFFSCCAIGSRDRSLSVWLTALRRPLVVTHDLFSNSILDISWSQKGMELIACSVDGTVAYLQFSPEELGTPLTIEEKVQLHQKIYGKSMLSTSKNQQPASQIIETTAMLKLQQQKEQERGSRDSQPVLNGNTPQKRTTHQIETKTPDGRRRITPIFLAPQPDLNLSEVPQPFSANSSQPTFTSSLEKTKIIIEKQDTVTDSSCSPTKVSESRIQTITDSMPSMSALDSKAVEKCKQTSATPAEKSEKEKKDKVSEKEKSKEKDKDKEREKEKKLSLKRKMETPTGASGKQGPGRPRKDRTLDQHRLMATSTPIVPFISTPQTPDTRVVLPASLQLPSLRIENTSIQVEHSDGRSNIEVENDYRAGIHTVHKVRLIKDGSVSWENLLSARINACCGSKSYVSVACEDSTISIFSSSGRQVISSLALDSNVAIFQSKGSYLMAATSKGHLYVWDLHTLQAVIKRESLSTIITDKTIRIESSRLTEKGQPILSFSNGKSFTYRLDLGCWLLVANRDDPLRLCSDFNKNRTSQKGLLLSLQSSKDKFAPQASRMFQSNPLLQKASSCGHLESQLCASLAIGSATEYKFWLTSYVRYLVQEDFEEKLREVCDGLLGPMFPSKSHNWESKILGYKKRDLLEEILPMVGANLRFQRLFTEYQEQLETIQK
ncbi:protein HIRA-like isoform X2 [Lineus longissimus]|uniref:protein HIRA-like isoform X2 n=1 Tax=Lineus longissimus TaxID=88925 RepID=UPI00315CBE19